MAYAVGDVVNVNAKKQDLRMVEFPNCDDLLEGVYNIVLVKNADGTVTFRFIAPLADGILSTISTLGIKGGIIVAKA